MKNFNYKSAAVAEIGDRGHNRQGRKEGAAVPLSPGELGPRLTQCGLGRVYFRTKWRLHPSSRLATIDIGKELRAVLLGPHLTQRRVGRGLPPYQVAS